MNLKNLTKEELVKHLEKNKAINSALIKKELQSDLYKFNKHILGVEKGKGKVALAPFHKELCTFVEKDKGKKKLILVPRGHLKSTMITVGYSLQRIVYDPSIRILIANATWKMSAAFLGEIKKHLKYNDRLIDIYGQLADDPLKWSEDMVTLKQAQTTHGKKEATVTAFGMGGNLVSQHYDVIILDDIVNRDMINTREQIEKTIMFYKDVLDLSDGEKTEFIVIGTRWHDRDLYDWLMDPDKQIIKGFNVMIKQAYKGSLEGDDFDPLWGNKFTRKHLQDLYREKGPYEFSCQQMNDPVPDEDAVFRAQWFKYYDPTELKGRPLNKYILVDPAVSLEKEADYTAMVVVGVDHFGFWYVLDIIRERFTPSQLISQIFFLDEKWHPIDIGIEDVAFQKVLQYSLFEEMRKRDRYLPIREVKPQLRTKDSRIRGLQPLYANGMIYHGKELRYNEYLEDELMRFPRARHDDIVDAFSYAIDIVAKPKRKRDRQREHISYSPFV